MVLSAVSMDSTFEVVDLVRVGERNKTRTKQNKTNNCRSRYAILTQFDLD